MGSGTRTIALASLLAIAAACGNGDGGGTASPEPPGGDGVAAEAWLADVCGATKGWVDQIVALQAGLQEDLDASSVEALKDTMVGYFDEVLGVTDDMLDEIDAAGVPDAEGGQAAADAVSGGLGEVRDVLQRARDDAADLPTGDPQEFSRELRTIAREVQTSLGEVGDTMAQLQSPELDRAAEDVPECRELEQV
jgi:hypothetical protein